MATSEYYLITNGELYIHFNPNRAAYFANPKVLGAAGFTQEKGQAFIDDLLGPEWQLQKIVPKKIIYQDRSSEPDYFKQTHVE